MPKKEKKDDSADGLGKADIINQRSHSFDPYLTSEGVGEVISDETRSYDGPVQVTPGHTYDM